MRRLLCEVLGGGPVSTPQLARISQQMDQDMHIGYSREPIIVKV